MGSEEKIMGNRDDHTQQSHAGRQSPQSSRRHCTLSIYVSITFLILMTSLDHHPVAHGSCGTGASPFRCPSICSHIQRSQAQLTRHTGGMRSERDRGSRADGRMGSRSANMAMEKGPDLQ